jgi:4a-hydroxytetrahydrobiopterin dehydratase
MEMMRGKDIAAAGLTDWRKLAQGIHARYVVDDFAAGVEFMAAVAAVIPPGGHHPRAVIGAGHVDLELVTADAIYRTDDGEELIVEWVTQQDVDLARRIQQIASEQGLRADPSSVTELELGLDAITSGAIAPMWAALLTGDSSSQGRGTPGDEVRDATARIPNLWFDDAPQDGAEPSRFHVEVYVPAEIVEDRIAAVVAAGGTVVDDSQSPALTVVADAEDNRGVLCADVAAAGTA